MQSWAFIDAGFFLSSMHYWPNFKFNGNFSAKYNFIVVNEPSTAEISIYLTPESWLYGVTCSLSNANSNLVEAAV